MNFREAFSLVAYEDPSLFHATDIEVNMFLSLLHKLPAPPRIFRWSFNLKISSAEVLGAPSCFRSSTADGHSIALPAREEEEWGTLGETERRTQATDATDPQARNEDGTTHMKSPGNVCPARCFRGLVRYHSWIDRVTRD